MGWAVFLIGCAIPVVAGWYLFAHTRADRLLTVVALTLLPPTIWAAALGLKIGPCKTGDCVSHSERNFLTIAVVGLVILVLAVVVLVLGRALIAAGLVVVSGVLGAVSVGKIDTVAMVMFVVLAASAAAYLVALVRNRAGAGVPDYPPV
jgi:hypothetical protein